MIVQKNFVDISTLNSYPWS